MFVEKLNAIDLHKFIKENIDETVKAVDIRPNLINNKISGFVYAKTNSDLEPNFIYFNDSKFVISLSNYSTSKKIANLAPEDINLLWQKFLYTKFGVKYLDFLNSETTK